MLAVVLLAPVVAAAPRDEEPLPDMDFLEFLGSWQTRDGQWVDPLQVENLPPGELEVERDSKQDRGKKPTSLGKDRRSPDSMSDPPPSTDDDVQSRRRNR